MSQSPRKKRNRWIWIPILLQLGLVGGLLAFIVLSNETVNNQRSTTSNICSDIGLTPRGKEVFESSDKMYLIPIYQEAAEKYDIPWEYLAGINYVESRLWTNQSASSVGAIGPMQFMERTWVGWSNEFATVFPNARTAYWGLGDINDAYLDEIKKLDNIKRFGGLGIDGDGDGIADPTNEKDAIHAAANYLARNGMSEGKIDQAIFSYNHSSYYVNEVKRRANEFTQSVGGCQTVSTDSEILETTGGNWSWSLPQSQGVFVSSPYSYGTCVTHNGYCRCDHGGIDFAGPTITGDPIVAVQDGTATSLYEPGGCGYFINIDHHNGVVTQYCHMIANSSPIPVGESKKVKKGEVIGKVGNTGSSTGPHLHFAVKVNGARQNPTPFIHMNGMK